MRSRRSVLASSGAAAALTLSGCSFGSSGGTHATHSNRALRPEEAPVVARTRAERSTCPQGAAELTAVAYDVDPDEIVVWTRARIIPGMNRADCESGWVQRGVDMVHDWSGLRPDAEAGVTWDANVVPTDKQSPEYTLQNTSNTRRARWQIRTRQQFVAESTDTYEFRSAFGPIDNVGPGDDLVDITVEFPVSSGGLFANSETFTLQQTLTYGDRDG